MKTVYCNAKTFQAFQNGQINIGDLLEEIACEPFGQLIGGLDHFEKDRKQIKIYDRGVNGRSRDIIVRPFGENVK